MSDDKRNQLISGGKDGTLIVWTADGQVVNFYVFKAGTGWKKPGLVSSLLTASIDFSNLYKLQPENNFWSH